MHHLLRDWTTAMLGAMLLLAAGWFGQRMSSAPHHGMPFGLWAFTGAILATAIMVAFSYYQKSIVTRRTVALTALAGSLAPTLGLSILVGGTMAIPFFVVGVLIYGGGLIVIPLTILSLVLLSPRRKP